LHRYYPEGRHARFGHRRWRTYADRAQFIVLHEGRITFEGNVTELLSSQDDYLREFLFMTLPPW